MNQAEEKVNLSQMEQARLQRIEIQRTKAALDLITSFAEAKAFVEKLCDGALNLDLHENELLRFVRSNFEGDRAEKLASWFCMANRESRFKRRIINIVRPYLIENISIKRTGDKVTVMLEDNSLGSFYVGGE